nr:YadA-like family protein [Acinetobacter baumannii]
MPLKFGSLSVAQPFKPLCNKANYNSNPVTSNGKGGVAIGSGLSTTHSSPIADGQGSLALGSSGDGTTINGTTYNQQGPDAKAAYSAALMAGSQVATGADKSIAFGVDAKVSANIKDAIALGTGAVASVNNSVALGGGSTTTAPTGTGYITNTTAPTSVVSVGSSTNLRRIQNVADGAADQDAVTVAQLKDVNNRAVGNTTALGGGAAYDPSTNVYTAPTFTTTKTDGTTVNSNTVSGALTNLNNEVIKPITFSGNTGSSANKLGSTLNITGTGSTAGTYSGNNLKTSVSGNTVSIQMADAPVFTGTVTAGNLATGGTLSVTGVSNLNGGANLNNQKITNVAAGTASGDAVNFGQLTTTNNNVTTAQTTANSALAEAQKGINFGDGSTSNNYALGETINVKGDSNINSVTTADGVQLSLASDISVDSVTAGNSKLNNSGLTITGGPSITTAGIDAANTNISNVADATTADQAVNKGQLDAATAAADNKTDALGNSTANNLGGGATYDSTTGAVTAPTYTVNGTDVNNVGAAISELDKGWNLASNGANAGAIKAGDTVDIGTAAGETNLQVAKSGNTIQYSLSRDLDLDSVTAGNSKLNNSGLTITGGPSITTAGIDAANTNISNVADATTADQAVNKGQLDAATAAADNKTDALGNSTANNLGGGATYDSTTGAVTAPTYTVNGTDVNNVGAAISELDKGWNLASNGANAGAIKAGDTVDIGTAAGETNLQVAKSGNTIQYSLSRDLDLDSVTAGNSKLNNSGLTITGGPSITTAGIDAANTNISNVADATTADQAVNKGQLDAATAAADNKTDALGNSTANNLGGGATYDSTTGAVTAPTYTVNGTDVNNVGAAISELDKGWNLASNGANAGAIKAGDTVDIGTAAGETNLQVAKSGNTIQYSLSRDLDLDSVTAGNSKLNNSGLTITGGPSITTAGIDAAGNTISNVAAGTNATDAVNKGQLDHVDNRVTQVTNTTASIFGGGAKANTDGSISNPTYNVAGTSANNVGDALTALDKAVTDAGTAANAGWTVSANGDAATAKNIKPNGKVNFTGDDNLTVAQSSETDNEGNIKVALNKNLKVDSVTTGNTVIDTTGVKVGNNVHLGSTGLIIAGGPSITTSGISAGNKTISNVAAGVSSTDAVNKGQLDSAISSINNNVGALANSAVQYDKNSDGSVNKDSITLAGGANGTTIKNVANGTVAEGSKDAVNGGQLWTVQQQVNKNTGDISNLQTDISNINNGKSGLVQQADKDAAITVGKDTGGTQVNVAGTAGERTVTGVKAGAVTESSKDAVNGSQLNTTNQALVNYLGGGAGYDNITQSFSNPTYNVGDQSYHNVGDAIGALNQADQTLNTKIDNVSNKLEQAFYATNQRIDDVEKRANAGIAAAMALENAPFVAGKYTYAVGAAYHGGENAVGVTLRKTADNGRWSLTGGVAAASQGDPSVRIGISGVID